MLSWKDNLVLCSELGPCAHRVSGHTNCASKSPVYTRKIKTPFFQMPKTETRKGRPQKRFALNVKWKHSNTFSSPIMSISHSTLSFYNIHTYKTIRTKERTWNKKKILDFFFVYCIYNVIIYYSRMIDRKWLDRVWIKKNFSKFLWLYFLFLPFIFNETNWLPLKLKQ